ncbi:hypothetical protein IT397_00065 [Candidatus Nomurabacteria bacterium]|nr:hypothetical protein [Candidatus Nomurabacteria bacterium]
MNFEAKNRIKKLLYSKFTLVLLFILLMYLFQSTYDIYVKSVESKNNKNMAEKELEDLKLRQETVSSGIESLNTNIGLEEEVRGKFDVVKENENMLIIVDRSSTSSNQNGIGKGGFWSWFSDIFK